MKVIEIIQDDIASAYPEIHATRLNTLFTFVQSGLSDQRLSVTYLGRGMKKLSKTSKKHDIKRADRLCANTHLHCERQDYYTYMADALIGKNIHPLLIVDWSPVDGQAIFQVLRVSIPMGGRALTIYEKVYPESELNSPKAHQALLNALALILPEQCQPIILSDAIFKTPWFKAIEEKGWYWVGRVRGNVTLSLDGETWHTCKHWFDSATMKPRDIGNIFYSKSSQFCCRASLYKGKSTQRIKKKKRGGKSQCTTDKYQQQKASEPWLLISNLPNSMSKQAAKVVKLYKTRMQIEEGFRDTKNAKLGLSLEYANSKTAKRYDNLLLVGALIQFVLWFMGYAAYQSKHHQQLQANTVKDRRVLSYIYVGREIIDDERYPIEPDILVYILYHLSALVIKLDEV